MQKDSLLPIPLYRFLNLILKLNHNLYNCIKHIIYYIKYITYKIIYKACIIIVQDIKQMVIQFIIEN